MSKYIGSTLVAGVGRNTERNANNLLDFKWSDHIINSMEWLRADTFSWQAGSVYQAAYNHLVADITGKSLQSETVVGVTVQFYLADDGHKICPASQESNVANIYSATGVAWYYILDMVNTRFKLPRINKSITEAQKYVDYTSPITITSGDTSTVYGLFYISGHSVNVGSVTVSLNNSVVYTGGNWSNERMANTCILFVRPGDIISWSNWNAQLSMAKIYPVSKEISSITQYKYLYFYVGQYTQSAIEQTAGLNAELFNGKADINLTNAVSNAGAIAKATIIGWDMPDYSAGVTVSALPFTAPTDGILYIYMYITSDYYLLYVNGNQVANAGGSNNDRNTITILLSKNDVVTSSKGLISGAGFYPLKGVL